MWESGAIISDLLSRKHAAIKTGMAAREESEYL